MRRVSVGLLVLLMACGRRAPEAQPSQDKAPVPSPPKRAQPRRIVAIGDLHGDLAATRKALVLAGAIDAGDRWIGGALVVVQTGDVLDRGDGEEAILELFERLAGEARAAGGALVMLNGNHELMNAYGDFRYVTPGGYADFGGEAERAAAFSPGGAWAKRLAAHDVIAVIGDSVFVHGGIGPADVEYGIARINTEVRAWLAGDGPEPTAITQNDESPVWTRRWAEVEPDCQLLATTLAAVPARRLVVGHTPQKSGVSVACDGALWRIDVGLASFYGGPLELLEIIADDAGATAAAPLRP